MTTERRVRALEIQVARLYQKLGEEMSDIDTLSTEEQQIEADQALEDQAIAANSADIKTALDTIQAGKSGQAVTPEQFAAAEAALQRVDSKIKGETAQIGTDDAALTGSQKAA